MLKISDSRNFTRTLAGLALIVGPALLLIAQIVSPDVNDSNKVTELANVAAHKSSYLVGGLLFLAASVVLLAASTGVIRLFRAPRVTLGQLAGGLLLLGTAATFAFYAYQSTEYEMVNHSGLDRAALAQFLDKANNPASGAPLFFMFVIGIVIGLIVLGVAVWRSRVAPRWAAVALVIAGPLQFIAGDNKAGNIVGFAVILLGLGALGWSVLSMSDEQWDEVQPAGPGPKAGSAAIPTTAQSAA